MEFKYGKGLPERKRKSGPYPVVGSSGIVGYHSEYLIKGPTVIIGRKGNVGTVQLIIEPNYPIDTVFYSSPNTPKELISVLHISLLKAKLSKRCGKHRYCCSRTKYKSAELDGYYNPTTTDPPTLPLSRRTSFPKNHSQPKANPNPQKNQRYLTSSARIW